MAPKRKSNQSSTPNKKAKIAPSPEEFEDFYSSTLTLVFDLRDDKNERELVSPFLKVPSKKQYPDYTQIVKEPIAISDIQRKVKSGKYSTTSCQEFLADFELLLNNAKLYNDPTSWIVEDATKIYNFVKDQVSQFTGGVPDSGSNLLNDAQNLIDDVIDHEFPSIGVISQPFVEDVDKNEYPDYFKVIERPTSFSSVLRRLGGEIIDRNDTTENNLERLHDEVLLIFNNAKTYNAEDSLLYEDADRLSEYFEEKFEELKQKYVSDEPKLTFKLKPAKVKEETPTPAPAPKKRGRKRKTVIEEPEENDFPSESEQPVEEEREEGEEAEEEEVEEEDEEDEEVAPIIPTLESNVMGRTTTLGSTDEVFIEEAYVGSSATTVPQILSQTQEINSFKASQPPSRYQLMKNSIFPKEMESISTLFEYKFPANGYCTQSYSLALPPDSSSFITIGFSLHEYLTNLKDKLISTGVSADEDFQCKLFVNDDEVQSNTDVVEEKSADSLLKLSYDLKLSYGLNIITFECKVAPSVSKVVKKTQAPQQDNEEIAGRHTRHQLQQMKMSWEVEKITFYIMCNSL